MFLIFKIVYNLVIITTNYFLYLNPKSKINVKIYCLLLQKKLFVGASKKKDSA